MFSLFPSTLMFLGCVLFGSSLAVSASNWVVAWVGMELNLFAFLPLVVVGKGGASAEGAGKYFLAQACGSVLFLLSPVLGGVGLLSVVVMGGGLLVKLGSVPAHYWFPATLAGVSLFTGYLLMTWQKVVPLWLGAGMVGFEGPLFCLAVGNAVVGAVGGFAQTQLRPLFGYASINQLGWMLGLMVVSKSGVALYLVLYSMMLFPIFLVLGCSRIFSLKVLGVLMEMGPWAAGLFGAFVLSMAGMPPLGGFFLKGYVLSLLVGGGYGWVAVLLALCSVVALAYYLNLAMLSVVCGVGVGRGGWVGTLGILFAGAALVSGVGIPSFVGTCLL